MNGVKPKPANGLVAIRGYALHVTCMIRSLQFILVFLHIEVVVDLECCCCQNMGLHDWDHSMSEQPSRSFYELLTQPGCVGSCAEDDRRASVYLASASKRMKGDSTIIDRTFVRSALLHAGNPMVHSSGVQRR